MQKDIVKISEKEKEELEAWIQETYGSGQDLPVDISLLILYKLHLLEEKINRIDDHTKSHWVSTSG